MNQEGEIMKLLSSDYDDTLFIDQQISQQDLEAIKTFQQQGHLFGINSGRHLDSIFEECDKYNLKPDFYVGNNGTVVLNKDREIVFISKFDPVIVQEILEYFRENLQDKVYFVSVNNGYNFGREFFNEGCEFLVDHTDPLEKYINEPISTMFSHVLNYEDTMPLVRQLRSDFEGKAYFYGNAPFIDMVGQEIDKASGINKIAELMGIKHENIYAIGDSYNDMAMLSEFHGFVMNHAKDSVKAVADEVVNSVSEAIDKILINNVK